MTTKHTPGPWVISERIKTARLDNALLVRPLDSNNHEYGATAIIATSEADARLIAAAPGLLDSLRECVAAYEAHRDNQPTGHLWPDPNHIFHARAAIANATGD